MASRKSKENVSFKNDYDAEKLNGHLRIVHLCSQRVHGGYISACGLNLKWATIWRTETTCPTCLARTTKRKEVKPSRPAQLKLKLGSK